MNKLSVTLGALLLIVLSLIGGEYLGDRQANREPIPDLGGANAPVVSTFNTTTDSYLNNAQDVIGTHIGSTTVGIPWPTINVTNTYISKIGENKTIALYQFKVTAATTSQNSLVTTVQGSNDYLCETQASNASSTTDVVQSNINWYDAMSHLVNRVHPTSFSVGSSSLMIPWTNVAVGNTAELLLTNLNYRCLRLLVSASSTAVYAGLTTK